MTDGSFGVVPAVFNARRPPPIYYVYSCFILTRHRLTVNEEAGLPYFLLWGSLSESVVGLIDVTYQPYLTMSCNI